MNFLGIDFDEFLSGNGIWILIGCLAVAFVVSVIFLILNIVKAKKVNTEEVKKAEIKINSETEEKVEIKVQEPKINKEIKPVAEKGVKPIVKKEEKILYSVTYDKESSDWVVKKSGATRASKRCKTKAEALEVVGKLSKSNDANVSVHKKDGKFQKK